MRFPGANRESADSLRIFSIMENNMSAAPPKKTRRDLKSRDGINPNGKGSGPNGNSAFMVDPEKLLTILRAVDDGDFSGRFPKESGPALQAKASQDHSSNLQGSDLHAP